ncbi:MAG: phosphoglucosamine mutase [Firmicutes bacterium]|nr:phosphoglucosamine mutase [Bacillota bacterium]
MANLRYFGTDGVRGKALASPLTLAETARWGQAWSRVAQARGIRELVIGWDSRLSSEPLAQAFLQGLGDGLHAEVLGLVPTPAVAWVTQRRPQAWGLMISASHNPPEDNGLKGFNHLGEKLSEEDEAAVEAAFEAAPEIKTGARSLEADAQEVEAYLTHLQGLELPSSFPIVVDCAHGATAPWAPRLLRGAVQWMGTPADGARINVGVGSTHMEALKARVRESGAAAGIAFDGDGDRCLFVDDQGQEVDGDQLMWLLAQDRHAQGLPLPGVVGTLMTNGGLEEALRALNLPLVRTAVGDKFMLRELGRRGWDLAAEASGHVIQKHLGPSGDGLATALEALRVLLRRAPETRWTWRFRPWPLRLLNLVAQERRPVEACTRLTAAMAALEARHGEALRLVVRWSGTEPKLRLMVEAREAALMEEALAELEKAAKADLGMV